MTALNPRRGSKALRPIVREPRSDDDLMAIAELQIHNRVGTMEAPNYVGMTFTSPALAGVQVGARLAGGNVSPLASRNPGRVPAGTSSPGDY